MNATTNRFKTGFHNWPILDGGTYIEADIGASVTVRAYVALDFYAEPEPDRPEDIEAFNADRLRYCKMTLNVYIDGACIEHGAAALYQIGVEEDGDGTGDYLTECANDLLDQIDIASIVGGFAKQATAAAVAVGAVSKIRRNRAARHAAWAAMTRAELIEDGVVKVFTPDRRSCGFATGFGKPYTGEAGYSQRLRVCWEDGETTLCTLKGMVPAIEAPSLPGGFAEWTIR